MTVKDSLLRTESDLLIFLMEQTANTEKNKYLNDVYALLIAMQPDSKIELKTNVKPENTEQFVKCLCCYIYETNSTILFSNDYTRLIRKIEKVETTVPKVYSNYLTTKEREK